MAKKAKEPKAADTAPVQAEPQAPPQTAPKPKGRALKVAALVIVLVVVVALILLLAVFGKDLFGKPSGGGQVQPEQPSGLIQIGTPSATASVTKEAADTAAQQEKKEGEAAYVYCRQLNAGDKVATMGDADKYGVAGPAWFVYIDEQPGMWFEHPVKYIFIDASTGEKKVYTESWPPEVNREDIFTASQGDCPGAPLVPATEFEAEGDFESNIAEL